MTADANPPAASAAASDQYATARANLRDTIKWLAATFSALAAVVVAGTPISGLGKLPLWTGQWFGACGALLIAFTCICMALAITVSLLRGDLLYMSDLKAVVLDKKPPPETAAELERLVKNLDAHALDVLPFNYPTAELLVADASKRQGALKAAYDEWKKIPDEEAAEKAAAATKFTGARDKAQEFEPALQRVLFYGSYFVFYDRLRQAVPKLFALGVLTLGLLAAFGMFIHEPDKPAAAPSIVNNISRATAACGSVGSSLSASSAC